MNIPPVLRLYRRAPLAVQAHVWVRWFTCPFARVAAAVPERGRVLEVGCGYGLFSSYLALESPDRSVLGVDIDMAKIVHARLVAKHAGVDADFHVSPPGELPDGPFDGIVIVDVLYLLDVDEQAGLLRSCVERLALGGTLVVKEMDTTPRWKARWNRLQEFLAVKVVRITAGDQLTFLEPSVVAAWLEREGLAVSRRPVDRGYIHPHHLIVGSRRRSVVAG